MKQRVIKIGEFDGKAENVNPKNLQFGEHDIYNILIAYFKLVKEDPEEEITFEFGIVEGGSASLAFIAVEIIEKSLTPVRTVNKGCINSAANMLYLAGHKREGIEQCTFYFHPFCYLLEEIPIDNLEIVPVHVADEIKMLYVRVEKFLLERTKLAKNDIRTFFNQGRLGYFDKKQAINFGLINVP